MPKVSIVVPVYNTGRKLRTCIQSVLSQTEKDFELILIDDGSTDESGTICDQFSAKDSRIRTIHQENNGSIAARRTGTMQCKAPFTCFCDADDTMRPSALSLLLRYIENADVCIGNSMRLWRGFTFRKKNNAPCFQIQAPQEYSQEEFISELYCSWFGISNLPVSLWGKLYRTELLQQTYQHVPSIVNFLGEDLIITLNLMPKAQKTVVIPDYIYNYRIGGGTSKYNSHMIDDWLSLYRYKAQFAKRYPMPQNIQKLMDIELCNMMFTYFRMLGRSGKLDTSALLKEIQRVLSISEVTAACCNHDIQPSAFKNVQLLQSGDSGAILQLIQADAKKYARTKYLKQLFFKLA